MKALKQMSMGFIMAGVLGTVVLGSYNSIIVNNDAFMNKSAGIKFTKRLDEINGKIVIGRMAASSIPWTGLKKSEKKEEVKKKALIKKVVKVEKKLENKAEEVMSNPIPAPAINADLELSLSNVFHKKPLAKGSFSGSAKTVDGVIEEIYVNLPGGKRIEINTRERMMGNVFQYEDTETREMKSAMFYEVKRGTYMITLTNDSQFAGTRLEFKANETEVAYNDDYYTAQESWEMDQQKADAEREAQEAIPSEAPQYEEVDYAEAPAQQEIPQESTGFNFNSEV